MNEDKELTAMTAVANALDEVENEEVIARVLQWVNSRYGKVRAVLPASGLADQGSEVEEDAFTDVAALFTAAGPTTDSERALVVSYWFQSHENNENIDAQTINTALKQLGHAISNITTAFNSLKARKPSLVIQVQKKGKTKQARKKYRLTEAGLQEVRRMVSGQTKEKTTGS